MGGLFDTFVSTIRDVAPIVAILLTFQLLVLRRPLVAPRRVAIGLVCVLVGLALFLEGLGLALFPLGKLMAAQLTDPAFLHGDATPPAIARWSDYLWVYAFGATIGFATTIAEPALLAVAIKAFEISGGTVSVLGLRLAVACGASIGIALGTFRIVTGIPIHAFIIAGYVIVIVQAAFAPRELVALAFDSGGVTTSTVTVPVVAALGLGLASTIPGRSPLLDGFGLIAFTCLFPIVTVMAYAQLGQFLARRRARARGTDAPT
jgi:hypothetical protein